MRQLVWSLTAHFAVETSISLQTSTTTTRTSPKHSQTTLPLPRFYVSQSPPFQSSTMDSQPVIDNPLPLTESKTARKKKAKAVEAGTNGASTPALPQSVPKEDSSHGETPADSASPNASEHPHLRELQKQIRAVNKKLGALSKTDAIQAENPGVSLDDLVAQRKINNDQRASAAKKPALQEQLKGLEEQTQVFTKLHGEFQETLRKNKEELSASHKDEVEKVREESGRGAQETSKGELRKKLLVFSQFLRAAASKRNVEEDAGNEENMAFEGALLLVYGGDEKAVEAAVNIIDGSEEKVPSIEGVPLGVKCKHHLPFLIPLNPQNIAADTHDTQTPPSNKPPLTTPPSKPKKNGSTRSPRPTPLKPQRSQPPKQQHPPSNPPPPPCKQAQTPPSRTQA